MKGWHMKYILAAAAIVAAVTLAGCGSEQTAAEPDQLVKTMEVGKRMTVRPVPIRGR